MNGIICSQYNQEQETESSNLSELFDEYIHIPIEEFMLRPRKNIRGLLVEIGTYFGHENENEISEAVLIQSRLCAEILETIHAGSLVVDDIQDGSVERRGKPALHVKYGIPVALNLGNWLYFWSLDRISQLPLSNEQLNKIYKAFHRILLNSHYGQALDLTAQMMHLDQQNILPFVTQVLELKTGGLTMLALDLGAILSNSNDIKRIKLNEFGKKFGVALQMFDDIGNLFSKNNSRKKFEDLLNKKPTWVWAVAAESLDSREYKIFLSLINELSLSDSIKIEEFIKRHNLVQKAKEQAQVKLNLSLNFLNQEFPIYPNTFQKILNLAQNMVHSYE